MPTGIRVVCALLTEPLALLAQYCFLTPQMYLTYTLTPQFKPLSNYKKMHVFLQQNKAILHISKYFWHVTFMLPCCIVKDFFLSNQPDAPIIYIYSVIKLYMIFSAHHQEFSTVHSILTLLGNGHQKPARNLPVPNVR
jgi:hypothetical protein